jgi:2-keto-3-deoxy-L-rhamnonate aldolase RhmA
VDAKYTYRSPAELVNYGDANTFVAIQIETAEAAQCPERIAELPDVDLLFIGPSDLSCTLGVAGEFHSDRLWEAIERVATACKNTGKHWGCAVPDAKFAQRAVELGCRMPTLGGDIIAMRRGVEALRAAFADQF